MHTIVRTIAAGTIAFPTRWAVGLIIVAFKQQYLPDSLILYRSGYHTEPDIMTSDRFIRGLPRTNPTF
jgi:hypothetical protein